MALHRDIFWIGRQWAVTGAGIQAVDQRLRGVLDIDTARLWDDALIRSRRAKAGVNVEDFDQAVTMARARYPQVLAAEPLIAQLKTLGAIEESPAESSVVPAMHLRTEGRLARFLPQWRIRR